MDWLTIRPAPLSGLFAVERKQLQDERGFFSRFFCAEELAEVGFKSPIAQVNHTLTRQKGAVRGLHFQYPPHAEDKFVSCLQGSVFDVAVDLRQGSPTFLQWHAQILSADNSTSLLIPSGFAHGFQALEDNCELIYLHSKPYCPAAEGALNLADPALNIHWPLPFSSMSARDAAHPLITAGFSGI
jgi:dTDP-4-dehydrorhamnose 3,5-epimerase